MITIINVMNKNKLLCTQCNRTYATSQSLWNHKNKFHNSNLEKNGKNQENIVKTDFNCDKCNKKFNSPNELDYHLKMICKPDIKHNNVFTFKTETFGKNKYPNDNGGDIYIIQTEFSLENYYKIGVTTNLYKRLGQYRCGAVLEPRVHCYFPIKNINDADKNLKEKLKKFNIKREIYQCENLNDIKNIIKNIQSEMNSIKLEIIPEIKECDVCECNYCNKIFTNKYELQIHEKSEHELNSDNLNCKKCNKQFNSRQGRWVHEKKCRENNFSQLKLEISLLKEAIKNKDNEMTNLKKIMLKIMNKVNINKNEIEV